MILFNFQLFPFISNSFLGMEIGKSYVKQGFGREELTVISIFPFFFSFLKKQKKGEEVLSYIERARSCARAYAQERVFQQNGKLEIWKVFSVYLPEILNFSFQKRLEIPVFRLEKWKSAASACSFFFSAVGIWHEEGGRRHG
ncbi:hypothetical protein [Maridesulfovibrio sp.]|uniref:hypothetical protein n=1 Tax=Maridesulfovibrio sp. TaxID=2795000 RepID=UPI0029CA7177|nr:hypothetical protein [Maridesulfovibrio sp.]